MRMRLACAVCIVWGAIGLAPHGAWAQDAAPAAPTLSGRSLEDLLAVEVNTVEGAARHTQRTTEAPASVTVVTATDIETFGWRTLADVLRNVRGFHMTYDRNYSYVGVRAFGRPTDYNNRVLVLVDGHRLNDSVYDGALLGTEFPVDLALVDRIEVIRGPGSALYGTSAFLAVVNVITKKGAQLGPRQLSVTGASFGTYQASASHGWSNAAGRDVLLSVSRYDSRGRSSLFFPEYADTAGGMAVGQDGDETTKVFGSSRLGAFSMQALYSTRNKHVPTASWDTVFGDPRYQTHDNRGWGSVAYTKEKGRATIRGRAYADYYHYDGEFPFEELNLDGAATDAVGGELSIRQAFGRHGITVGVEPRFNTRQNQWNRPVEGAPVVDARNRSRELGLYIQDEIAFTPRLTGIVGGRYDWWSLRGGAGRPRLGLVYRTEQDTALKVLYGEAYRAPTVYELYYFERPARLTIDPEIVRTLEVVAERHVGRRLRVAASVYDMRISDLIDAGAAEVADDITSAYYYANGESARSTGVELEGESRWPSGLLLRGSMAVQRARSASGRLSNAPGQLGTLQVAVPLWRRELTLATDNTYTSLRTTVNGDRLPAYWLSNVTATYRPRRFPIAVGASLYNAFDVRYSHPVGVEFRQPSLVQDGRSGSIRLTVRF
jgi:outer membrane receptor for ferrienterochelin and colicins